MQSHKASDILHHKSNKIRLGYDVEKQTKNGKSTKIHIWSETFEFLMNDHTIQHKGEKKKTKIPIIDGTNKHVKGINHD